MHRRIRRFPIVQNFGRKGTGIFWRTRQPTYFSAKLQFQFIDKEIDKAFALDKYLQLLGIKCENVISFGKGENDTSIIAYAGNWR